jgi:CHASE2 domain-containing sensor protein
MVQKILGIGAVTGAVILWLWLTTVGFVKLSVAWDHGQRDLVGAATVYGTLGVSLLLFVLGVKVLKKK